MRPEAALTQGKSQMPVLSDRSSDHSSNSSSNASSALTDISTLIISREISADSALFALQIPEQLVFFEGHFEDFPILPGVVQVDWVYKLAEVVFNLEIPSQISIPKVKFSYPVYPGTTIDLRLDYDFKKGRLSFNYQNDSRVCSSGVLRFAP